MYRHILAVTDQFFMWAVTKSRLTMTWGFHKTVFIITLEVCRRSKGHKVFDFLTLDDLKAITFHYQQPRKPITQKRCGEHLLAHFRCHLFAKYNCIDPDSCRRHQAILVLRLFETFLRRVAFASYFCLWSGSFWHSLVTSFIICVRDHTHPPSLCVFVVLFHQYTEERVFPSETWNCGGQVWLPIENKSY